MASAANSTTNLTSPTWSALTFATSKTNPASLSTTLDPVFPSCLLPNFTFALEDLISFTPSTETPELCQKICEEESSCIAVTWTQESSPVFPLSCATFSSAKNTTECEYCVSGPPVCHCSIHGECETTEGNVVEVLAGLLDEDQCAKACLDFQLCSNYTYFGPENPMRFLCFLLSSCEDITTDCHVCDYGDFVDGHCSTTTVTSPATDTTTTTTT